VTPWGVYVHVPWCRARCPYCAFAIVPEAGPAPWRPYVAALSREWARRAPAFPGRPDTLFLGGGTPSRLPPAAIAEIISLVRPVPGAEISAEANPDDLDDAWLHGAMHAGVTRVSLGVQTLQTAAARRLGRAHTLAQASTAIARLAAAPLASWSVDLIFAVPGQTLAHLDADLDAILSANPPHVATYGLTIEPGTAFARATARGSLPAVADTRWREMYDRIVARLAEAGLPRYEVSNFARPGHRCRHNEGYWTDRPYAGLGPGAHGYAPDGARWSNAAPLSAWQAADEPGGTAASPLPRQAAIDLLVSGVRGLDGVSTARLASRTGLRCDPDVVALLVAGGALQDRASHLTLAPGGYPICDAVVARLAGALQPAQ